MNLIYIITLLGTFLFAISGMIAGGKKKLDLFGLGFVGFVTALGGGTIRDLLIGCYPISWVADLNYALTVAASLLIMALFGKKIMKLRRILLVSDIIGVAIFTILGLQKSIALGVTPGVAVIFGVVSAIMGGVLRDTLCNEIPYILQKELYAIICLAGGIVYVLLIRILSPELSFILSVMSIIAGRILAFRYKLSLPAPAISS